MRAQYEHSFNESKIPESCEVDNLFMESMLLDTVLYFQILFTNCFLQVNLLAINGRMP